MRYLSVCSGIEAATVAWHRLGWEPAAFCEIEAFPSAVLTHHYPKVTNYGDFTRISESDHPVRTAGVELLVGGTPCQAFSVAGLRRGLADPRGGLTLEFVRLAQALRPRWIVWENVPGVLSQDGGRAFGAFLGALVDLGYGFAYRVLDAQWFGVAQRRRRVFVVASARGRADRAAEVLFEPEGMRRDSAPRREARKGSAFNAGASTEERKWPSDVACTLAACFGEKLGLEDQHVFGGASLFVPEARFWNGNDVAEALTCTSDDQRMPDKNRMQMVAEAFDARQSDVLMYGDKTGPLDTDGHSIGVSSGMSVRRLTPRECERLQGFPDDYTAIPWKKKGASECPDGPRYRALGNSMAVPVMRWIGERIAKVEAL